MVCNLEPLNDLIKGTGVEGEKEGVHNRTLGNDKGEKESLRKTIIYFSFTLFVAVNTKRVFETIM